MEQIGLVDSERRNLMELKLEAPHKLMKKKSEAMLLLSKGIDIEIVADLVDREPSTVASWARDWRQRRQASIHTGHADNLNASKLTATQRAEVAEVLAQPPSDQGLPAEFWSVPKLANWVSDRFDVIYESDTSYHYLLHMGGLSFHRPAPFDKRRGDEASINQRMAEIRDEIAGPLADPGTIVVAADEVRLEHEAVIRRAWIPQGATPHVEVDRQRQAISYIGFLNQNTGSVRLQSMDWQNAQTVTAALERFTAEHPGKQIVIVWAGASWHRSKHLRAHLGENNTLERIRLIHMPPYAPDHNPIEHVWNEAKNQISNLQRDTFDQTRHAFETYIQDNTFPYRLT